MTEPQTPQTAPTPNASLPYGHVGPGHREFHWNTDITTRYLYRYRDHIPADVIAPEALNRLMRITAALCVDVAATDYLRADQNLFRAVYNCHNHREAVNQLERDPAERTGHPARPVLQTFRQRYGMADRNLFNTVLQEYRADLQQAEQNLFDLLRSPDVIGPIEAQNTRMYHRFTAEPEFRLAARIAQVATYRELLPVLARFHIVRMYSTPVQINTLLCHLVRALDTHSARIRQDAEQQPPDAMDTNFPTQLISIQDEYNAVARSPFHFDEPGYLHFSSVDDPGILKIQTYKLIVDSVRSYAVDRHRILRGFVRRVRAAAVKAHRKGKYTEAILKRIPSDAPDCPIANLAGAFDVHGRIAAFVTY